MKYTALTIGPIHKTLQSAKSTKAIWAASYMFSYLMKEIIKKANLKESDYVILPQHEPDDLTATNNVGLFPDRLIVKGEILNLQDIIDQVKEEFAQNVAKDIGENQNNVVQYFKEFFNFNFIELDLPENTNVIFAVTPLLDTAELKQPVLRHPENDFLNDFLENKYYNFLIINEIDKKNKRFPSTIEIANAEFKEVSEEKFNYYVNTLFKKKKDEDKTDNQQNFIDLIRNDAKFKLTYRNYQKYITVVQADGDNIGSFIKQLYEEKTNPVGHVNRFSANLMKFSKEAVKLIEKYQGTPVYAGGDDLLFLAPVAHTKVDTKTGGVFVEKSILTLIDKIDKIFNKYFLSYNEDGFNFKSIIETLPKKPSMSYGVSVSYYKFPLNEALAEGVRQLFYTAKQTCNKNAVSYAVLKHSGQYFGTTFHKNEESFKTYNELIAQQVQNADYIHGVVYKLEPLQAVFYGIGLKNEESKRNAELDNFFPNNFNESIHIQINKVTGEKELTPFLQSLKQLFKDVYTEHKVSSGSNEDEKKAINTNNLNKIYAALRFIGFLNEKEER